MWNKKAGLTVYWPHGRLNPHQVYQPIHVVLGRQSTQKIQRWIWATQGEQLSTNRSRYGSIAQVENPLFALKVSWHGASTQMPIGITESTRRPCPWPEHGAGWPSRTCASKIRILYTTFRSSILCQWRHQRASQRNFGNGIGSTRRSQTPLLLRLAILIGLSFCFWTPC